MAILRGLLALIALLFCAGCGYVHFGRLPAAKTGAVGDEAYSSLLTEQKILKQELALARKEGDSLRDALERASGGSPEVVAQLNTTTRELASLRASYARLQAERSGPADRAQTAALEEKLAAAQRDYSTLQNENSRLRADLDQARNENSSLADQLKTAHVESEQAQAALAQLNAELLAQKDARNRADQAANAARAQLAAVMAAPRATAAPEPAAPEPAPVASAPAPAASGLSALQLAKAPPADLSATAELRTNPERLRAAAAGQPTSPTAMSAAPAAVKPRTHVVQEGDTLEKIAKRYYGDAQRWPRIYAANNDLLRDGRPLKPGMELEIP
jgi:nucleoid-associated protein YgaU